MKAKQNKKTKNVSLKKTILPKGIKDLYQGETLRFLAGMLLLITALFMLLAFSSNFVTGKYDQSGVVAGNLLNAANYGGEHE